MPRIIAHSVNESLIYIESEDQIIYSHISNYFQVYAKGYLFNPNYKLHRWDGKIHFFNLKNKCIPSGLLGKLEEFCELNKIELLKEGFGVDLKIDPTKLEKTVNSFNNLKIRDYQFEALTKALENRHSILECATGSGKSLIIYDYIRTLLSENVKKVLLIVPNQLLVEQMSDDFKSYGWTNVDDYSEKLYAGHKPTYKKPILISTWQSLMDKESEFFEEYDCVIVDETHKAKANVLKSILTLCINAKYRLGTTGTLPDDKSELYSIFGSLGKVVYQIKTKTLQDAGILSPISICSLFLKYPIDFIKNNINRAYPEEVKLTEEYSNRNEIGLKFILSNMKQDSNTLIMFKHIKHLKSTQEYIKKNFPNRKCVYITGEIDAKERNSIRKDIENESGTILLATYETMSTGVNIKKLNCLIFWSNSKSKILVLQSIGRILRKCENKDKVVLFDVIDDMSYKNKNGSIHKNNILKQYSERKKYYKNEEFENKEYTLNI